MARAPSAGTGGPRRAKRRATNTDAYPTAHGADRAVYPVLHLDAASAALPPDQILCIRPRADWSEVEADILDDLIESLREMTLVVPRQLAGMPLVPVSTDANSSHLRDVIGSLLPSTAQVVTYWSMASRGERQRWPASATLWGATVTLACVGLKTHPFPQCQDRSRDLTYWRPPTHDDITRIRACGFIIASLLGTEFRVWIPPQVDVIGDTRWCVFLDLVLLAVLSSRESAFWRWRDGIQHTSRQTVANRLMRAMVSRELALARIDDHDDTPDDDD
jgi:hypothetical protein